MRIIVFIALLGSAIGVSAQSSLRVVDSEDRLGMQGATVRVGSLHLYTNEEGMVKVPVSVRERDSIHVSFVGYMPQSLTLRELKARKMVVVLEAYPETLVGLTVESTRKVSNTTVGEYISAEKLNLGISTDLAEVLKGVKGVSILTTGGGDVVPSIHGMYGDRLLIVSNGVRQEAQQWSTEFMPKVDFGGDGSIAVLKGAEAVRYGSDALGGVILHESTGLPFGGRVIAGTLQSQFGTNGRTVALQGSLEGAMGQTKDWAWRVQGKWFRGGDRSTAHYLLNNTGTVGGDLSATIGWKGERSGADVHYSLVNHTGGVFYGAQMGDIDLLRERIKMGRPEVTQPFTYVIDYPKHNVIHQYVRAKGYVDLQSHGRVEAKAAYQRDRQREYHYRRSFRSNIPAVSLTLNNVQLDATWQNSYLGHWKSEVGIHGAMTNNFNEPGTGVVPLIPNYVENIGSVYGIQKYVNDRWSAEFGVRYDHSYLNAAGIDLYSKAYGGEHRYNNFTYSAALHYSLTDALEVKMHYGTAWRAPNVSELYSNGLDLSGGVYLTGDSTMTTERNRKWVTTLTYSSPKFSAAIEGYLQWIGGYIYQQPQKKPVTVISGTYPNFRYLQTATTMHGVDADMTWTIIPDLEYHAQTGMIWAAEQSTGKYLPLIPPFYFAHSLNWRIIPLTTRWSDVPVLELEHRYTAQQKRFDPATDLIDTTPPAFHLLGASLKWGIPLHSHKRLDFYLTIENLLNQEYKEYTNAGRYYAHSLGRDVRFSIRYKF